MEYHPDRNPCARARRRSSRRSPRRTRCSAIRRSAPPTTATARPASAGAAAGSDSTTWICPRRSTSSCATSAGWAGSSRIFGGGARQDPRRGQDVRVTVKLTLADVATGVKKTVKLKTLDRCSLCAGSGAKAGTQPTRCSTCGGSGEVRRAARSMFGQFVSVSPCPTCAGEGQVVTDAVRGLPRRRAGHAASARSRSRFRPACPATTTSRCGARARPARATGPTGDLLVMLDVKDDERFERHGDDLVFDLPVSFSQAALGAQFADSDAVRRRARSRSPPAPSPRRCCGSRASGLPRAGAERQGRSASIRVHVWTPERLTEEQQRLFQELAKLEGEPPKRSPGFWSKLKEALGA